MYIFLYLLNNYNNNNNNNTKKIYKMNVTIISTNIQ